MKTRISDDFITYLQGLRDGLRFAGDCHDVDYANFADMILETFKDLLERNKVKEEFGSFLYGMQILANEMPSTINAPLDQILTEVKIRYVGLERFL